MPYICILYRYTTYNTFIYSRSNKRTFFDCENEKQIFDDMVILKSVLVFLSPVSFEKPVYHQKTMIKTILSIYYFHGFFLCKMKKNLLINPSRIMALYFCMHVYLLRYFYFTYIYMYLFNYYVHVLYTYSY